MLKDKCKFYNSLRFLIKNRNNDIWNFLKLDVIILKVKWM